MKPMSVQSLTCYGLAPSCPMGLVLLLLGLSLGSVPTQSAAQPTGKLQGQLPVCGEGRVFGADGQSKVTLCFGANDKRALFAEVQDHISRVANEHTQTVLREVASQANVVGLRLSQEERERFVNAISGRLAAAVRGSNDKLTDEVKRLNSGLTDAVRLMEQLSNAASKKEPAQVLGASQVDALVKLDFSRFEQSILSALQPIAAATAQAANAVSQLPNQSDEAFGLRAEKTAMRSDLELFRNLSGPVLCSRLDGEIGHMLRDIDSAEAQGRFAGARLVVRTVREQLRKGVSQLQSSEFRRSSEKAAYQDAVVAVTSALSRIETRTRDLEQQAAKLERSRQRHADLLQSKGVSRRTRLQARIDDINSDLRELRNSRPTDGATRVPTPQASAPATELASGEAELRTRPSGFGSSKDRLTELDRRQAALSDKLAQNTVDSVKKTRIAQLESDLAKAQSELDSLESSLRTKPGGAPQVQAPGVQGEETGHRPTRAQRIDHGHAAQQALKVALNDAAELTRTGQFAKAADKLNLAMRDSLEVEAGRPALSQRLPPIEAARVSRSQICE